MRPIEPLADITMRGITPAEVGDDLPVMRWVAPSDIYVEDEYQRDLSERSIAMIRKIVRRWRWAHIKPVICAQVRDKLMAIDGQHTAIAAATLGVDKIPAMVVRTSTLQQRAEAFIGQNCDRLNLTPNHIYFAALAANEEVAVATAQACKRAGVTILRASRGAVPYRVGETLTVGLILRIVKARGVTFGARVLRILVQAKRAPLTAVEIAAVAILLREPEFRGKFEDGDLVTVLRSKPVAHWVARAEALVARGERRRMAVARVLFSALAQGQRRAA